MTKAIPPTEEQELFFRSLMHIVVNSHEAGQPYLRQAFFKMTPYHVAGSKTMAIDKYFHVYIDFDQMMKIGKEEAAKYLNHEVWHPLRNHSDRIMQLPDTPPEYDKDFAGNIAGDLEINDDINEIVPLIALFPTETIFEAYPRERTLEQYYDLILNDLERLAEYFPDLRKGESRQQQGDGESGENGNQGNKGEQGDDSPDESNESSETGDESQENDEPQDGAGEKQADEQGESSDNSDKGESGGGEKDQDSEGNPDSENSEGQGEGSEGDGDSGNEDSSDKGDSSDGQGEGDSSTGDGQPGKGAGDSPEFHTCGSAAGMPEDYEIPPTEEEIVDSEVNNLQSKIADDIKEYVKERGNSVGDSRSKSLSRISKWAEDNTKVKYISWKQMFRGNFRASYAKQKGKLIYSYTRLSRRQPIKGILFPGSYSPKPTVGIGIDVSGSNVANLRIILKEIVKIIQQTGVANSDVKAFAVDVGSSKVKTVTNPLTLLDDLPVGGGTRMAPGYTKLAELAQDVSLLITDGYVHDYPEKKPLGTYRKSTVFLTCIVLPNRSAKESASVLDRAQRKIGSWSKIVPIYLNELD